MRKNPSNTNTGGQNNPAGGHPNLYVEADEDVEVEVVFKPNSSRILQHAFFQYQGGFGLSRDIISVITHGGPTNDGKAEGKLSLGTDSVTISDSAETILMKGDVPNAGQQRAPLLIVSNELKTEGGHGYAENYTNSSRRPFKSYLYCSRFAPSYFSSEGLNPADAKISTLFNPYTFNWREAPDPNWSFWADSDLKPVDMNETDFTGYQGTGTRSTTLGTSTNPVREVPISASKPKRGLWFSRYEGDGLAKPLLGDLGRILHCSS